LVGIPNSHAPNIGGRLLLEEGADLLDLGLAAGGVEEEVAELAAVGLDVNSSLSGPGIALEHQDLVLGSTFLLDGVHGEPNARVALGGGEASGTVEQEAMIAEGGRASGTGRRRGCAGRECRKMDNMKDVETGDLAFMGELV
jgi:hypothetical protein